MTTFSLHRPAAFLGAPFAAALSLLLVLLLPLAASPAQAAEAPAAADGPGAGKEAPVPEVEAPETEPLDLPLGDPERRDRHVELVVDAGVDTRTGRALTFDELAARLDGVGIVLAGEDHDSIDAHRVQEGIVEALVARGRRVAVGFEMLPATARETLARWSAGELSEERFVEEVDWYGSWGLPWEYYRDVFRTARRHRLPLFGLNVPREVVRAVRAGTVDELAPEIAAQVPPAVDLDSEDHRTLIRTLFAEEMGMHGQLSDEQFEAMFAAQATWDAAMAYNASRALASLADGEEASGAPILVVLVGSGHVAYGLGVERQARAWTDAPVAGVIPVPIRDDEGEPADPVRASYADVVWGLPPAGEPFLPGLGAATMDADPGGPDDRRRVIFVAEGSPAEAAGFVVGDLLLELDGQPITGQGQLARRMAEMRWGDRALFRVERDGEPRELTVLFRRSADEPGSRSEKAAEETAEETAGEVGREVAGDEAPGSP